VHDAIDPELERGLRGVSHVLCVSKDIGLRCPIINQHGFAGDIELIASGLRLGKGLKSVSAVPEQIVPLRRGWGDQHEETVVGQDRAHRVEAWGAILPGGGEKGQSNLELKEQRSADLRQIGFSRGELLPRHHRITSRRTRSLLNFVKRRRCSA
jgi:hypothetical protein